MSDAAHSAALEAAIAAADLSAVPDGGPVALAPAKGKRRMAGG